MKSWREDEGKREREFGWLAGREYIASSVCRMEGRKADAAIAIASGGGVEEGARLSAQQGVFLVDI